MKIRYYTDSKYICLETNFLNLKTFKMLKALFFFFFQNSQCVKGYTLKKVCNYNLECYFIKVLKIEMMSNNI